MVNFDALAVMAEVEEILARLVGFASVSGVDNEDLVGWIEQFLQALGVWCVRLDDCGGRMSLLARVGEAGEGGVVLSGHLDVVPVAGQPWSREPFVMWQEGGRFFGRGVCDMKGFVACVLALVRVWQMGGLRCPVYLAFTRDEEVGCLGAPAMAKALAELCGVGRRPVVVVGEPTRMNVVVAQKGITNFRTSVRGVAGHSSLIGLGVSSAVHVASHLVVGLEALMWGLRDEGKVEAGFDVNFSTLHVGKIAGGEAVNIQAQGCWFDWEVRHLPSVGLEAVLLQVEALEARLMRRFEGVVIEREALIETVPALANRDNARVLAVVGRQLDVSEAVGVAYATEAGTFQRFGFETVIVGPGDIAQAHQADEWIEREQLVACVRFLQGLVADCCGGI